MAPANNRIWITYMIAPFRLWRSHTIKIIILLVFGLMVAQYGFNLSLNFSGYNHVVHNYFVSNSSSSTTWTNKVDWFKKLVNGSITVENFAKNASTTTAAISEPSHPIITSNIVAAISNSSKLAANITVASNHTIQNATSKPLTTIITTPPKSTNKTLNSSVILPPCPAVPPKLVGPVKVWTNSPSYDEIEALHPELEIGGRYRPPECTSKNRVAIIIPYRDRDVHLRMFLHNMHPILERQQLDYGIYVIEQAGTGKFNRAMLMNIGFVEALNIYDYQCFVFHDVDLLPEDDRNLYTCPDKPRHMSVAVDSLGYKLPYSAIFGGVSALTRKHMETVNGFSNEFWGWGGEDDDMSNRITNSGLKITRYSGSIARYKMMKHKKDEPNPERYKKLYQGKKRYKTDGISNVKSKYNRSDVKFYKLYTKVIVELFPPKGRT